MTFFRTILNFIERADRVSIERMRIGAIVLGIFVFGITLRSVMFFDHKEALLAAAQPAVQRAVAPVLIEQTPVLIAKENGGGGDVDVLASAENAPAESTISAESVIAPNAGEAAGSATSPQVDAVLSAPTVSAAAYSIARGTMPVETVHEKNSRVRRAPASLTKLMTAVIVMEQISANEVITITDHAVATEGVAGRMRAGEQFFANDLMTMMLMVSSNDAAAAFADHTAIYGDDFVGRMNEKARELGMNNTHFANPTGLDNPEHYSTAFDLALLASYSLRHKPIWDALLKKSDTVYAVGTNAEHGLFSNNPIVQKGIAGVVGSKTGYTDAAGECMITALENGTVVVVLGSRDRARDTEKLIAAVNNK